MANTSGNEVVNIQVNCPILFQPINRCLLQTVLLSTPAKLFHYCEQTEITEDLGGFLHYDHDAWIKLRLVGI